LNIFKCHSISLIGVIGGSLSFHFQAEWTGTRY